MSNKIIKALELAVNAHDGQKRWGGTPYIIHPVRVAFAVKNISDEAIVVALLHDVVEDTEITLGQISKEFGPEIGGAVDAVTKRQGEPYEDYMNRVITNQLALVVKEADLHDNTRSLTGQHTNLKIKYERALKQIEESQK